MRRLGDEDSSFLYLFLEFLLVLRQEVCFRVKPEVLRPVLPEFVEHVAQSLLLAEVRHGWNPVDFDLCVEVELLLRKSQS